MYSVGIDVDGVLRNIVAQIITIYKDRYDKTSSFKYEDVSYYNFAPLLPVLKEKNIDLNFFFREYPKEIFFDAIPQEDNLPEKINLISKFLKVHIITKQLYGNEKYTLEWLYKYGIKYDSISFCTDKSDIYVDFMIDDYIPNMLDHNKKHPGSGYFIVDQPWNERLSDGKFIRIKSISDFLRLFFI